MRRSFAPSQRSSERRYASRGVGALCTLCLVPPSIEFLPAQKQGTLSFYEGETKYPQGGEKMKTEDLLPADLEATRLDVNGPRSERAPRESPMSTICGEWQTLRRLGDGALSEVFLVRHLQRGYQAVLKWLKASVRNEAGAREQFRNEVEILRLLKDGKGIVKLHPQHPYKQVEMLLTRPIADAQTLEFAMDGHLAPRTVCRIVARIAGALGYSHQHHILHRDVKPKNILVTPRGLSYLIDWGTAIDVRVRRARSGGAVLGTPLYMAPEQAEGAEDHRSDIYSLGCTLFELLTGKDIVEVDSLTTFESIIRERQRCDGPNPSLYNPKVPNGLGEIVARCLRRVPSERFESAFELQSALLAF